MGLQLTAPIYYVTGEGPGRMIQLQYDPGTRGGGYALNFCNFAWRDSDWGIARKVLHAYPAIVTDNDLIAHDDYIAELQRRTGPQVVVLVFRGIGGGWAGASKKRLRAAEAKLKAAGIRVRYCASEVSMHRLLERLEPKQLRAA